MHGEETGPPSLGLGHGGKPLPRLSPLAGCRFEQERSNLLVTAYRSKGKICER
jgi:hypothetical protein